jgi:hypothetical protein
VNWSEHIYQEVDGFYYYDPPPNGGCYPAHILRTIADKLDEMNKPWQEQIERDFNDKLRHGGENQ